MLIKCAVVADRLDRATFHGFYGKLFFFSFGLFCYKGIPPVIISVKHCRGNFPTKIAINTLLIYIKLSRSVILKLTF